MGVDLQRHPLSAAFGDMPKDEFDELVADIKKNGLISPVVYITDAAGTKQVLDGWHRYRACLEAGVEPRLEPFPFVVEPADEQSGRKMTPAEFVVAQNAHRRHLTREQRRQVVVELLKAKPEASDRTIASMAKVDHKTVGAVRREAEATGEIPQLDKTTGKDGKTRAKPAGRRLTKVERDVLDKNRRKLEAEMAALQASRQAKAQPNTETVPAGRVDRIRVQVVDVTSWALRLGAALEVLESWEEAAVNDEGELREFATVDLAELDALAFHLDATREGITAAAMQAGAEAAK